MNRLVSLSCGSLKSDQLDVLRSNGIKTVADFISCDVVSLAQKTSIPAKDLSSIQSIVIAQLAAFPLNGKDYYNGLMTRFSIFSTGCKNLDELLDGGLYTGDVTEIVGAAGTGKSQICMNIALSTSMEAKKYVIYIDTGGSFCGERIKQLLEGCKASLDDEEIHKILSRISVIQAFDIFSMLEALESVRQRLVSETEDEKTLQLRLVIVDCLAAVVSPVLGGQQIHGHSLMVNLSRILKSLAVEHALAVVITNNVVADSSWSSPFSTKPALGPTWGHVPNTRVFIQKQTEGSETNRIATITKSSRQQ
ncbi:DNA repair protein RAD51 homolog 4-like isoform X3 [Acropora millepora]|uniref:DNA repair protein RAD51 homolog 4-like isoform X3 n=1 Tax=Acropora millepora TaxID=45264 RepID=UPI001CF119B7|nr:DNA repair protein RAD51 homolog 4-like isoform X3 [Acropora millepora]